MPNPTDFYSEEDYRAALEERWATPSDARAEYAANAGAEAADRQWILTPWDTWEQNPCYAGPPQRHPEADEDYPPPLAVIGAQFAVGGYGLVEDVSDEIPF